MKIAIVIPLKAKSVSKNWDTVSKNLCETLYSIQRQTNQKFCAVVVGHDHPLNIDFEYFKNISFLNYNQTPPPQIDRNDIKDILPFERDKFSKIVYGLEYLIEKDSDISHCFALDADDLIRDCFVNSIFEKGVFDSYIIERGYLLYKERMLVNLTNELPSFCASSTVIDIKKIGLASGGNSFENTIYWKHSHVDLPNYLINNTRACVIKERLVMYTRDNGENISAQENMSTRKKIIRTIKSILKYHPFKNRVLASFGF